MARSVKHNPRIRWYRAELGMDIGAQKAYLYGMGLETEKQLDTTLDTLLKMRIAVCALNEYNASDYNFDPGGWTVDPDDLERSEIVWQRARKGAG